MKPIRKRPAKKPEVETKYSALRRFKRYLVTGSLILGPVVVTGFLLWKSFLFIDGILSKVVNALIGMTEHPIPGLGFITLLIFVTLAGFAARNVFGQWIFVRFQKTINQIPLVNRIYKAIQQISEAIFSGKREVFKSAVLIEYPRQGIYSIAIMTADTGGVVQEALPEDTLSVFLPTTPNPTSGYLLFVPKKDVIPLDITVEEALKLIISGGTISSLDEMKVYRKKQFKPLI